MMHEHSFQGFTNKPWCCMEEVVIKNGRCCCKWEERDTKEQNHFEGGRVTEVVLKVGEMLIMVDPTKDQP